MRKRYVVFGLATVVALSLAVPALGGPGNPIADGASAAKSTASKALKKAKKANSKAKAAQSAADAAQADANAAQQTANSADNKATEASTKADEASAAAAAAQTTADGAQTTADAAAAAAAAAQDTADSKYGDVTFRSGTPTAVNSSNKSATVSCATGEELVSGGWTTTGNGNNDITPTINSSYFNAWIVGMEEIGGGTADTWGVTATMICIDQT